MYHRCNLVGRHDCVFLLQITLNVELSVHVKLQSAIKKFNYLSEMAALISDNVSASVSGIHNRYFAVRHGQVIPKHLIVISMLLKYRASQMCRKYWFQIPPSVHTPMG